MEEVHTQNNNVEKTEAEEPVAAAEEPVRRENKRDEKVRLS